MTAPALNPPPIQNRVTDAVGLFGLPWKEWLRLLWQRATGVLGAQYPAATVTLTGSPHTYTLTRSGVVFVSGGTVSAIAVSRAGTSTATGLTSGAFPLVYADSIVITYTVAPTVRFLPSA